MTRLRGVAMRAKSNYVVLRYSWHGTLIIAPMLALVVLTGCDSGRDTKLQEDERNFDVVVKSQQDRLQWELDQSVAQRIFWRHYDDAPDESTPAYEAFIHCHEEPPTHASNKKLCADLQARVARQEAKVEAQANKERAEW
jgi:hypothetical protein